MNSKYQFSAIALSIYMVLYYGLTLMAFVTFAGIAEILIAGLPRVI